MKATLEWRRGPGLALLASALVGGASLSGCLQTSALECTGGSVECNATCVLLASDPGNCGACGLACQPRAVCIAPDGGTLGECVCPAALELCEGTCSDATTDPNNCGACASNGGAVCASGQVCAPQPDGGSACQVSCGTAVECNGACVTLSTDPNNCGACGNVCAQGYSCHSTPQGTAVGACLPDVVVSCISSTYSVAPIFDSAVQPVAGPGVLLLNPLPGGLGILGDGLLVATVGPLTELVLENLALPSPELPAAWLAGPNLRRGGHPLRRWQLGVRRRRRGQRAVGIDWAARRHGSDAAARRWSAGPRAQRGRRLPLRAERRPGTLRPCRQRDFRPALRNLSTGAGTGRNGGPARRHQPQRPTAGGQL